MHAAHWRQEALVDQGHLSCRLLPVPGIYSGYARTLLYTALGARSSAQLAWLICYTRTKSLQNTATSRPGQTPRGG